MVEFINKMTGTSMYVPNDRLKEYETLGHTKKGKKSKKESSAKE